jgi:hypothetical protein
MGEFKMRPVFQNKNQCPTKQHGSTLLYKKQADLQPIYVRDSYSKTRTNVQPNGMVALCYVRTKQICSPFMFETHIQKLANKIPARLSAILLQFPHGSPLSQWADAPELNLCINYNSLHRNPYLFTICNHISISCEGIKSTLINKTVK